MDLRARTERSPSPAPAAVGADLPASNRRSWTLRNHLILSLIVLGVGAIMIACWSLAAGGIGWDAPTDTAAGLQVRSIPSSDTLTQAYDAVYLNSEFYGVFIQQFGDVLRTIFTGSAHHLKPEDKDAATYLYQGGITLALSVLSVTAL